MSETGWIVVGIVGIVGWLVVIGFCLALAKAAARGDELEGRRG